MPGPWRRSSECAEVVATRSRMAKAAERAALMGAWLGVFVVGVLLGADFCTGGVDVGFAGRRGARGPVDLCKMLTGVELEVAGELGSGHARFAFELDFVEDEEGVVGGTDEKLFG